MPTTSWNDAEDEALIRLPLRARVLYLQGIRRNMDYRTGVAGRARILSYQFFTELLQAGDRTTAPDPTVTKRGLQTIFLMLERVGLVEWMRGGPEQRGVVFRCLLADTDQSVQNQAVPKRYPSGTQEAGHSIVSNEKALGDTAGPKRDPSENDQAVPPPEIRYPEDNLEQIEMDGETPKPKRSRGSRLSIPDLPEEWRAFAVSTRPDLDPEFCWQKFRDYWVGVPGQKGSKLDWLATWRNFIRSEHTPRRNGRVNGHDHHRESAAERRARINTEFIDAGRRAFESEMG